MSGLEVAGVILGAFPLLLSGIEHWRDVAKVGDLYRHIRKHYKKCQHDIQFHGIIYKNNLRELLVPLTENADEVARLVADPGGQGWGDAALQKRLEGRLNESYHLYQSIISEMNDVVKELSRELQLDNGNIQTELSLPEQKEQSRNKSTSLQASSRSSKIPVLKGMEYELFRTRFSFGERKRNELLDQLQECNERLEKLVRSSDKVSACQDAAPRFTKQISAMDNAFRKIARKADVLYRALKTSWECSCQSHHTTNLRLEHRTFAEVYFEIVLTFIAPSCYEPLPWRWRRISCGEMPSCSAVHDVATPATLAPPLRQPIPAALPIPRALSSTSTVRRKRVGFAPLKSKTPEIVLDSFIGRKMELCHRLGDTDRVDCMGIISHDDQTFHVHPTARDEGFNRDISITLDHILSHDFEGTITRRQRYWIAFLLASSVGQLQSTPWLRTAFCKRDVIFYPRKDDSQDLIYGEPFIRQDSSHDQSQSPSGGSLVNDRNFYALGILLVELCFGRRLEDLPTRKNHLPTTDINAEHALDVLVAMKWAKGVDGEGGDDYATAVRWCFDVGVSDKNKDWRTEFVRNVVRPLEVCIEHFARANSVE